MRPEVREGPGDGAEQSSRPEVEEEPVGGVTEGIPPPTNENRGDDESQNLIGDDQGLASPAPKTRTEETRGGGSAPRVMTPEFDFMVDE